MLCYVVINVVGEFYVLHVDQAVIRSFIERVTYCVMVQYPDVCW
jgi:hypothetical protein